MNKKSTVQQLKEEINSQLEFSQQYNDNESIKLLKSWAMFVNNNAEKLEKMDLKESYKYVSEEINEDFDVNDNHSLVNVIIKHLGGDENIIDIDACITKLRLQIKDKSKLPEDEIWKEKYAAIGVVMGKESKGTGIQIAYGPRADVLKGIMNEQLGRD